MTGLFARFRGGGGSSIEADLRRITDSDVLDVPKDVLMNIVQASHSADDRREIMKHIRVCLAETEGKKWRRIYGGLVLVEQLLQRGSRALMVETAEGHHFDLVQRLTFLESFEYSDDKRVQAMVRQKATVLRSEVITRIDHPGDTEVKSLSGADVDAEEEREASHVLSSASSASVPPRGPSAAQKGPVILNGVVSVGHRDDTTSEESGAEDSTAKKIEEKRRGKSNGYSKVQPAHKRQILDESTDSDSSSEGRRRNKQDQRATPIKAPAAAAAGPVVAPAAAETVDLLGM